MGSAFNHTKRQSLQSHIETLIHPATLQAELSVDNMQATASPHHRNALGKLGRGGVHSSGSSGNTIFSTHRATGTWSQEEIRRERGKDYQKGERAAEEEADNKRKRSHSFLFPFLW